MALVARVKGDGSTIHYYHADFRGSVVAMTNASQAITHKYQYDEYGNQTNSQEADANPFRYVGTYGIMYETADLSYMRARYYDPTIGRFNSTDPIWSTNLYPYANDNPIIIM
ncbi:MAG: RHS repeat-associated core domain-containing protein [Arcicella sp.]|nr:RHS repeat-associated core domain-containing protein [Arcicella sp.]